MNDLIMSLCVRETPERKQPKESHLLGPTGHQGEAIVQEFLKAAMQAKYKKDRWNQVRLGEFSCVCV